MTRPMPRSRIATATAMSGDRPTSCRIAMTTPPTAVIGAATSMTRVMKVTCCTCCTSLVLRVMSDGAPNSPSSREEKPRTCSTSPARTSRPTPMAVRAAAHVAPIWAMAWTALTPSMRLRRARCRAGPSARSPGR
ncbi:hypothetical protein BJF80_00720 [Serinicoccus sp. CUA-874]|nr:hypothetical protein BJF80_00720 [Serinicoccus sp. CUA-874]